MSATQSRLLIQLIKQQARSTQNRPIQKKLEDLYQITCKQQSNNLKLVEFIMLSIEKKLLTNTHGLKMFSETFEEFGNKPIESDSSNLPVNPSMMNAEEQRKFHKQRFLKIWPELAKRTHPGDDSAYQKIYYPKLVGIEVEENRMKLDDASKKLLTKQNLKLLIGYKDSLSQIFTMYNPENYNRKLKFFWSQVKLLNRKLPILCCLRFLLDAEICPGVLSVNLFFQIVSKFLPPSNNNHRQTLFYNSQTISTYVRDHCSSQKIKFLEGDIGMLFYEFELIMMRIAIEVNKQLSQKGDLHLTFKKFFNELIGISSSLEKEVVREPNTKFIRLKRQYDEQQQRDKFPGYCSQTPYQKECVELKTQPKLYSYQSDYQDSNKTIRGIEQMKAMLDEELPKIPQLVPVLKENQGIYDMNQKCIIIGQQPPKIVEKVRVMPRENKKPVDQLLGQRPQVIVPKEESHQHFKQLLNPSTKQMKNNNFYPVLLSQTVSPRNLVQSSQLYVQTCFINLYQHNYKEAKEHLNKAKTIQKTLSIQNKIFFLYVEGQINEAMGEDQEALDLYFKCLDLIHVTKQTICEALKALPYCGIGSCLYHASEFEYSLRCFLKAKQIREDKLTHDTEQYADLLNNLGCCFLKLCRASQARKSFEYSYKILDDRLGVYHQKTLVVLQNLNKSKKCFVERIPEYKSMWKTFSRKTGLPPPKKKK